MKVFGVRFSFSRTIGFIGVGKMGSGMIQNLAKQNKVLAYDTNPNFMQTLSSTTNITKIETIQKLAQNTDTFICMLPNDSISKEVCDGQQGLFRNAQKNSLIIDCSTISPYTSMELNKIGLEHKQLYVDAPVSGGVGGASLGTLSFMIGTDDEGIYKQCEVILQQMGKNIFNCQKPGGGQVAKICNNMALAIEMVAISEALALGQKLGLDPQLLSKIFNVSSSRCWSSDTYNPAPDVIPTVPSSKNYEGGFATELMLKDLTIATQTAKKANASIPLGDHTFSLYQKLNESGLSKKDFSIIFQELLKNRI